MFRPSKRILAVAVSFGLLASSFAVSAKSEDKKEVYNQTNVGISAAIDRYVSSSSQEENEAAAKATELQLKKDADAKAVNVKKSDVKSTAKYPEFEGKALVTAEDAVNIRQKATTSSDAIGYLGFAYTCEVAEKGDDWTKIKFGDGFGYVKSEFLLFGDEAGDWAKDNLRRVATVTATTLRVRTEASLTGEVITLIPEGGTYTVLEQTGEWTKISIDTDLVGYVSSEYVDITFATVDGSFSSESIKTKEKHTTEAVNGASDTEETETETETETEASEESYDDYSDDSDSDDSYDDYSDDDSDSDDSYDDNSDDDSDSDDSYDDNSDDDSDSDDSYDDTESEETYDDSDSTDDTSDDTPSSDGSITQTKLDLVNYALQFVGNPYVYGGTDLVNGCDCSGFTYSVFAHFGYSLYRGAEDQVYSGRRISVSEVEPGDLLFYGSVDDIGHVVIYIGNGMVVHASCPEVGIIISPMDYRTPVAATRIIE